MSKLFEKLVLSRLKLIIAKKKLIINHQFDFRDQRASIYQVDRLVEEIEKVLENKRVCTPVYWIYPRSLTRFATRAWSTN